jgi:hypothetical protein
MAAGITVRRERFDEFRARFEEVAARQLGHDDLGPEQRVDIENPAGTRHRRAGAADPAPRAVRDGNPAPVFGVRGVGFTGRQRVGVNHLRGTLLGPTDRSAPSLPHGGRIATLGDGRWTRLPARAERIPRADPRTRPGCCPWRRTRSVQGAPVARLTRIIAGTFLGRRLQVPADSRVRPTRRPSAEA